MIYKNNALEHETILRLGENMRITGRKSKMRKRKD